VRTAFDNKRDAFAELYLDHYWPKDWDEGTGEWDAVLEDWLLEVDGALADRLHEFKNEREQQKAEAAVEASRG